jgi:hypothetical protein
MKNRPSTFQKTLVAMVAMACLAAPRDSNAQTPTPSTPPPNPNASAQVPPPGSMPPPGTMSIMPSPTPAPSNGQTPTLPYGATEVLKMYQGGIGKDVILNYINNTTLMYHLTADGIIYLQGLGVPQEITKAMILRDGQLQQQQWAMVAPPNGQQPGPPQGSVPPPGSMPPPGAYPYGYAGQPVEAPSTPPPDVTVIGAQDYPAYDPSYYGWPYYGYYGPVVVGGWGWGWGHGGGWGGYRGGFGGGFHGGGFAHGGVGGGFHGGGGSHGGHR